MVSDTANNSVQYVGLLQTAQGTMWVSDMMDKPRLFESKELATEVVKVFGFPYQVITLDEFIVLTNKGK